MVSDVFWHVYVILNAKSDEFSMGQLQFSFALELGMAKFLTLRYAEGQFFRMRVVAAVV